MTERDPTQPITPPDEIERRLGEYTEATRERPGLDFTERVMRSVEAEPAPRRGLAAWLALQLAFLAPLTRAAAVAAVLVLAVIGALAGAELAGVIRNSQVGGPSAAPSSSASVVASPSPSLTPSPSVTPTPTLSPSPSSSPTESVGTPQPSATESEEPEATEEPDESHESETPGPSDTPEPSDDHSAED